ncbi:hypothetical protein [Paraburkholderia xenovorans]
MVEAGRSIAQAIAAGNYHRIEVHSAPDAYGNTRVEYRYDPPACETVEEVAQCFVELFGRIKPGCTAKAWRITGGRIGAYIVEDAGDVTGLLQ